MSAGTDAIIKRARFWADPGQWKPQPENLAGFFKTAGCEALPSIEDATRSLATLDYGCYIGKQVKHWCGIFACAVLVEAGVRAKWSLLNGQMSGTGIRIKYAKTGMKPGDVAILNGTGRHHIIITKVYVDAKSNRVLIDTIEGNTKGNWIRTYTGKSTVDIVAYYQIQG